MNIAKIIGDNLKSARKLKNLTQKEVASHMFMTQQQYSRFENGIFQLNYEQIISLCELLDVTPNELYGFENGLPICSTCRTNEQAIKNAKTPDKKNDK